MEGRNEAVAARLRSLRAERRASQKSVAKAIGASVTALHKWERSGGMSLRSACALADYYGVSLDQLVGRDAIGRGGEGHGMEAES